MPTILSPRQWGALVDYDQWNDRFTPDDGVALHHGGGGDYAAHRAPYSRSKEIQQLQQWEGYHIFGKGWRGLAYGFGVGQTGDIYRIRGFNTYGAHRGDLDGDGIANNAEIVPILFIGSGSRVRLSQAAQDSISWLRANVIEVMSPRATRLYGHTELRGTVTSCPGAFGMEYVRANREVDMARFKDVPETHTHFNAIEWLAEQGITAGTNPPQNDEFSPDRQLTRAEFATLLKRYHDKLG